MKWCPQRGLNSRPSVYKTAALPLCYMGVILVLTRGIEPRSPVYETGVLAVELDEHIWWTD